MSSTDQSMDDTIMEEDESFASNANATIYGASYISGRTESLISDPNILNSSSTSEDDYHQQQISTAAGGGSGDTSDDLIVSSCASSNLFTNNNRRGEVRIFNVDFRALLSTSHIQSLNQFAQGEDSSFRMWISDSYSNVSARNRRQSILNKSIAFFRKLYHEMMSEQIRSPIIYPNPIRPWIPMNQSVTKHADNFEGGVTWAYEVGSQSMVCPIIVQDLNQPRQMLVEMLCEERDVFLEIADIIRGLGFYILKGVIETTNDKIWARFAVEANRDVTRMEIFISLVRLLEQTSKGAEEADNAIDNDTTMVHSFHQAASIPATDNGDLEAITETGNGDKGRPPPILGLIPGDYPEWSCIIKERMTQALHYLKESTVERVLAQVWVPVKKAGRSVLTTSGQPFVLDPECNGLHQYRMVSLMYMFAMDGETDGVLGLPGRVFRLKLPEWTPNVQYYSSREFHRLNHALHYNVRGTLALPVFEPSGRSCVSVLELIMTSQKINYAAEVDKICKALEAVNLKSSEILDHPNTQICNERRQNALVDILEILTAVCETYKLPLAQTWVPCRHRSVLVDGGGLKKSCSSSDGSCMGQVCMSTTDLAFYVVDAHMWGFREACAEHHLQKGQGVAGRAYASRKSCYCEDITQFCKTEYPLVHYARLFGLTSCFAICLRSSHTANDDYILEFFLPPNSGDYSNQQALLNSLLMTMKQHFRSLSIASGGELEHDWSRRCIY